MKCLSSLALVVVVSIAARGTAATIWSVAEGGNGHAYELVRDSNLLLTWVDAKAAAETRLFAGTSGYLVSITSAAENNFILNNFYDGQNAWIGLTDDPAFGGTESSPLPNPKVDGWVWVSGEPVSFTYWDNHEPNNNHGDEHYVHLVPWYGSIPGGWNDLSIGNHMDGYIVEYPVPELSGASHVLLAALCFVATRIRSFHFYVRDLER